MWSTNEQRVEIIEKIHFSSQATSWFTVFSIFTLNFEFPSRNFKTEKRREETPAEKKEVQTWKV